MRRRGSDAEQTPGWSHGKRVGAAVATVAVVGALVWGVIALTGGSSALDPVATVSPSPTAPSSTSGAALVVFDGAMLEPLLLAPGDLSGSFQEQPSTPEDESGLCGGPPEADLVPTDGIGLVALFGEQSGIAVTELLLGYADEADATKALEMIEAQGASCTTFTRDQDGEDLEIGIAPQEFPLAQKADGVFALRVTLSSPSAPSPLHGYIVFVREGPVLVVVGTVSYTLDSARTFAADAVDAALRKVLAAV